ncbi:MAG: sodium-dependent transporter [Solobacterium sp.]|nr:sodium-dependent transporter [Solobacterium sp.]
MKRDTFGSRIGFILVSAGCAIGIGNVWKFPYLTGENGGGIFVLLYLFFLLIMGLPVMTMELAVGRASRKSAVQAYKALEPKHTFWHIHGWICILGCALLMMYYTTVSGWMLSYFLKFLTGQMSSITPADVPSVFSSLLDHPLEMGIAMAVNVIAGFMVCSFGIQSGLERVSKIMMSCLLILILLLAGYSMTLPGAREGLSFYLYPDVSAIKEIGLWNVVKAAMNQSFFTLSLGIAAMEVFGSYMSDSYTLVSEATRICILDTAVAIISGLIIFPACFSFGVTPDSGPSLIFLTLPTIFASMPGGQIFGTLFFLFMTFASFSTVITVFENLISAAIDNFSLSRKHAVWIHMILILLLSLPCVLGYNVLSNVRFFGGKDILDSEDFLVSSLILPLGSLVYLRFCTSSHGWGFEAYRNECNKGAGIQLPSFFRFYLSWVLPALILIIFISGLL